MKCGVNAVMLYCDPTKFELRSTRELQVILTTTTNGHFIQQSLGGSKVATVYERRIEAWRTSIFLLSSLLISFDASYK